MAFCFLKKVKIRCGNMEHFILEVTQSPPAFRSCFQPGKKSRGAHEAGKSTHNLLYFPVPTWKELSVNIGKPASLFSFKLLLKRPIGWGLKKKKTNKKQVTSAKPSYCSGRYWLGLAWCPAGPCTPCSRRGSRFVLYTRGSWVQCSLTHSVVWPGWDVRNGESCRFVWQGEY